jgi:bifunctional non-homologous end joining protein LigD
MTVREVGRRTVEISNPDKVLFPDDGMTKADLADYYARIAETMLPHVRGRPATMQRYPDGIEGETFFQKDIPNYFPDWIKTVEMAKEGGIVTHLVIEEAATLVYLANQACITPHVWLSRADRPHHPDRIVFDFDPPGKEFAVIRDAARRLRDILEELGLVPFVMTSGSRGLHVVAPLKRTAEFDEVRTFARGVAELLVGRHPDRLTTEHRKNKRGRRIFVDTMRNSYAQTAVAPYAVRARAGAPVAAPLDWDELGRGFEPRKYTIANVFRRLARKDDPWAKIERQARALDAPRKKLDELKED